MDRRSFLLRGVTGSAGLALLPDPLLAGLPGFVHLPAGPERVFVLVELAGGNDGLNTVVPRGNDIYEKARPRLAQKTGLHALEGDFALHPAMAALAPVFGAGELAVIHGVGYPKPNRSHFRSMDVWQSARPGEERPKHGWLGRAVDALAVAGSKAALPALSVGQIELPLCLHARKVVVPALASLADYELRVGRGAHAEGRRETLGRLAAREKDDDALARFLKATAREAYASAAKLSEAARAYEPKAQYPQSALGRRFELAARSLASPLGTRVVHLRQGGYDTHASQASAHANLLRDLSNSLAAFAKDLRAQGLWDRTLVVCFSEFGRRVAENQSRGTDHGCAGPVFALGGGVKGGMHGAMPSLADLDQGDLEFTTDFRRVYREVLEAWLGVDPKPVLDGDFEAVGFV